MSTMAGEEYGHAVQVVRVSECPGERYEVDEAALTQLLARDDLRDKPVAVVSVAGPFRGGKSFLLGFFLRYLNASRANQMNGQWLGREDEPLRGFHWRAGCERDTTGIHLWSKPVVVRSESGQEVVVLLMDTQGTFDTESTLQDSSTIFALSTLISSVQIYNIFRNIQEDDLQHLHLFTDYGRLAAGNMGDGGKAFQVLQFLVRDWTNAHEYPHGMKGGDGLLAKRLELKNGQKPELREVREHIHSCFERIKCFLMPHPGLVVGNADFSGCLSDISEQFRMSLLELVPSLFDPENLTAKVIGGSRIKARDLPLYFKNYADVFNSEEMPPAVSILKGTATACLVAAARDAHDAYDAAMETGASDARSVTPAAVRERHDAALHTAKELFNGKRKLGSKEDAEEHLDKLVKELEARLPLYNWRNEVQVREAMECARRAYSDAVARVCDQQQQLCLHPCDLADLHRDQLAAALDLFDSTRDLADGEVDDVRDALLSQLTEEYEHLCSVNVQNNSVAVVEAREEYSTQMKRDMAYQTGISTEQLEAKHERATRAARDKFHSRRSRPTEYEEDEYMDKLLEDITEQYAEFERLNVTSNRMAMQAAEHVYNSHVARAWGPQGCCFHPRALRELHAEAAAAALNDFQANRAEAENDDYRDKLTQALESRFGEHQQINKYNNRQAVSAAFGEYTRRMDKHSAPALTSFLLVPFVMKLLVGLPHHHARGRIVALAEFSRRRREPSYDDDDEYLDTLKRKINAAYENYKHPLQALIRELGLPVPN